MLPETAVIISELGIPYPNRCISDNLESENLETFLNIAEEFKLKGLTGDNEANEIENMIREQFPNASITITDLAGDGNHYSAEVIDVSFKDMNRVQQQRAVYAALKGKMDGSNGELHALALTTKAPSDS